MWWVKRLLGFIYTNFGQNNIKKSHFLFFIAYHKMYATATTDSDFNLQVIHPRCSQLNAVFIQCYCDYNIEYNTEWLLNTRL